MSNFHTLSTLDIEIEKQHRERMRAESMPIDFPTFREVSIEIADKSLAMMESLKRVMIASGINVAGSGYIVPEGPHQDMSREIMGISTRQWNTAPIVKHAKRRWRVFLE